MGRKAAATCHLRSTGRAAALTPCPPCLPSLPAQPVLFPFGYGLSLTTFGLAWDTPGGAVPQLPPVHAANDSVALPVTVSNSGARDGVEVVQVGKGGEVEVVQVGTGGETRSCRWGRGGGGEEVVQVGTGGKKRSCRWGREGCEAPDNACRRPSPRDPYPLPFLPLPQVYATATNLEATPQPPGALPARQLVAFARVAVSAQGSVGVVIQVPAARLLLTAADGSRALYDGAYTLSVSRGHGDTLGAPLTVALGQQQG